MRVGPQLARVTRHCLQLQIERRCYVDPGVGNEASRISPLSAACRVKRINGFDERFCGSGGDEQRLKQKLMISVHVATELAVDNARLELSNHALQGRDQVRQAITLQALVGEV